MAKQMKNKPVKEQVAKSAIGMIIDGAQIIAVQVSGKRSAGVLNAKCKEFLPKGLVEGGLITDPSKLGEIAANLLKRNGFSAGDIVFGAKGQNVLMRIAPFAKI